MREEALSRPRSIDRWNLYETSFKLACLAALTAATLVLPAAAQERNDAVKGQPTAGMAQCAPKQRMRNAQCGANKTKRAPGAQQNARPNAQQSARQNTDRDGALQDVEQGSARRQAHSACRPTPPIFSMHCYAVRHAKTPGQFGEALVQRPQPCTRRHQR